MYSEELQQMTRDHFEKDIKGAFMKHFGDSKFGLCILQDGKYIINARGESDEVWEYSSMDDMIEGSWALD